MPPTMGNVSWAVAATQMGGCGFWNGRGTTPRSLNVKNFPECENRSCVQALRMMCQLALGWPVSESDRLRYRDGGHEGGDRRRSVGYPLVITKDSKAGKFNPASGCQSRRHAIQGSGSMRSGA